MYYNLSGLPTEVADVTGPDFKWGGFSYPDVPGGLSTCGVEDPAGCTLLAVNKTLPTLNLPWHLSPMR